MKPRTKKIKRPKKVISVIPKQKQKSYLASINLNDEDENGIIPNTFFEASKNGGLLERPLLYKFDFKNSTFYGYDTVMENWFTVRMDLKNISTIVVKE